MSSPSPDPPGGGASAGAGSLAARLIAAHPELERIAAVATDPLYVVGGAVRDLLLGGPPGDVDLVVGGDPATLASALGVEPLGAHPDFGTLKLAGAGREVDVAAARTETYARPGALPTVATGATIDADLARRDFTVNALAVPLAGDGELIDRHGGRDDLERRRLRVLHPASFVDDPTRALRAARYAARLGFALEPETERMLRRTDLATISPERRAAELLKLAAEPTAPRGFALLAEWDLVELRSGGVELATKVIVVLGDDAEPAGESRAALLRELRREQVARADAVLAAALGPAAGEEALAAARPERPSEAVDLARGHDPIELVLARAHGAEWLDDYLAEWSRVRLEIDGSDLVAAGIDPGPAVGRGLAAALAAKLDNGPAGRDAELAAALTAARAE